MKDREEPKLTKRKEAIWRQQIVCKDKKTLNTTKQKPIFDIHKNFKKILLQDASRKMLF